MLELWERFPCMVLDLSIQTYSFSSFVRLIPETKGRSLEEMDIIFGAVNAEERRAYIEAQEKGLPPASVVVN